MLIAAIALLFLLKKPAPVAEESTAEAGIAESAVNESEADESTEESLPPDDDSNPFNEDLTCKVHTFGDWKLVMNHLDIGTEARSCLICGVSESRRHLHEFTDPITLPSGRVIMYCLHCPEVRFGVETGGKGDPCDHKENFVIGPLSLNRGQVKLDFEGREHSTDLDGSYFYGWEYGCDTCGLLLVVPHNPSEPVYEPQEDGTILVRIHCLSCGFEFTGDSFVIEADGHYRSHMQHPVVNDAYTLEGLTPEEAEKYHVIIECSCGETLVKEEHNYENGYRTCVCGKKEPK